MSNVTLHPDLQHKSLDRKLQVQIEEDAKLALSRLDPLLYHTMAVKIVTNPRRNFINIRVKDDYVGLLFHRQMQGIFYCFFLSDKLEPFIIITAVHPVDGKLVTLNSCQVADLREAIKAFKAKYGISEETYHYTGLGERQATDEFSRAGHCGGNNRSHSSHFHLKMRIATGMYKQRFPVLNLFDFDMLRQMVEPVGYNYNRETVSFEKVMRQIQEDAVD